jgi:hypothetical protein
MSHEELRDRLLDLAYGELSPREARELEDHAASCEACGAELARIRGTRRLMAALPEEPAPAEGERILLAAAREAAGRRAPRRLVPRWAWTAAVAAASLAAVAAVSWRIVAMRPGGIGGEDPQALLGDSPYARPPRETARDSAAAEEREPAGARGTTPEQPAAPGAGKGERAKRARGAEGGREAVPSRRFAEAPPPEATPPRAAPSRAPAPQPERQAYAAAPPPASAAAPGPPGAEERSTAASPPPSPPRGAGDREGGGAPAAASRAPSEPRASAAAKAAAPAAVLRYDELRRTGRLQGEIRTFPGCDGELWRKVERDPDGRVVSYAREGFAGDRRVRVEAIYDPDGAPARVAVKDAATSAPIVGMTPWVPAADDADGPPRCGRGVD